jgi:MSHA biogenesis protein MshO
VLAQNVSTCSFVYDGSSLQRNAMVQVTLGMTRNGETVNLYHEVHVDNTP